jgi:hypothetical protein
MPTAVDFPTKGKLIRADGETVVFSPSGTSYELYLKSSAAAQLNTPIEAVIRAKARKVYTVPSGGNFTAPIQGPPRIIQGWVLYADEKNLIVHAGANFNVELPNADSAIDLDEGPIAVNKLVNVTLLPGATFDLAQTSEA